MLSIQRAASGRRLAAAGAAALLAWRLAALRAAPAAGQETHIGYYADGGEALLRGVSPPEGLPSFHLPLAEVSAALVFDRAGLSVRSCRALVETLQFVLVFAAAGALEAVPAPAPFLAVGLLAAFLLYRSPLAFFPPLFALFERAAAPRSERPPWKLLAVLCLVPYLFLLPGVRTNWIVHRRLIPFEYREADANIVTGALGLVQTAEGNWRALVDEPVDASRGGAVLGWAVREVLRHPARYLGACVRRAWFVLRLRPVLWLLAALGLWRRRGRREFQALGLLGLYFAAVYCLMPVQENYFTPLWPILCLPAAAFLAAPRGEPEPPADSVRSRESAVCAGVLAAFLGLTLVLCAYTEKAVWGYAAAARRSPAETDAAWDRAVAASPRDSWLRAERGRRRLEEGDLSGAAADLQAAEELGPDPQRELRLAWVRMLQGKPEALFAWAPSGGSRSESDAVRFEGYLLKAYGFLKFSREPEARRELEAAVRTLDSGVAVRGAPTPLTAEAARRLRSGLGLAAAAAVAPLRGRPEDERLAFLRLLGDFTREPADVWIDRARDVRILAWLAGRDPGSAVRWSDLGVGEYLRGRPEAAAEDLRRALSLDPSWAPASLSLAAVYSGQRRYAEALATLDRALAADPGAREEEIRRSRREVLDALAAGK
jgi:tetratricopeptide (TPR) repeat protein